MSKYLHCPEAFPLTSYRYLDPGVPARSLKPCMTPMQRLNALYGLCLVGKRKFSLFFICKIEQVGRWSLAYRHVPWEHRGSVPELLGPSLSFKMTPLLVPVRGAGQGPSGSILGQIQNELSIYFSLAVFEHIKYSPWKMISTTPSCTGTE